MKVAFQLRRRPESGPASAVLVEGDRVEPILGLAARMGGDHAPVIHRVAGGFLLKLVGGPSPPAGPIRLRSLAENLYVPVDADLVPALLDDEAGGLTRDQGLVFLPGGRILGFDPARPWPASAMVEAPRFEGGGWRAFPDRPSWVDRIREITLEPPDDAPEDIFEPIGGQPTGIGTEGPPRPGSAGAASELAGRAAVGAARGLIGLGTLLGIQALADLGARWIGRAVERVPRLTEAILGQQEGALRELLRQFRAGDVDRALSHALPLGGEGGRGGVPSTDGELPTVDPTYSLRSLLGSPRGPGGIWFGGYDVQAELAREYRKAAEEAERRGDYRRAASILGRLLNDHRTAAHLLVRGGLHRDAAILYLDRVGDIPAAARAFEAAGEVDRALRLYRREGMHAEAGDLLRRSGEDEAAVEEYLVAAALLASAPGHGRLAAGDLLRDRARRPDLALGYYAREWADRPSAGAVTGAIRVATIFAEGGEAGPLMSLVHEADGFLLRPGQGGQAGQFYNALATLADREGLAGSRDDLRDRALMGLAAQLRQASATGSVGRPGELASTFLGHSRAWPVDVVGDATHALKGAFALEAERRRLAGLLAAPAGSAPGPRRIEVGGGVVSAACLAPSTGEVFLGFEGGQVYRVDVGRGVVSCLAEERSPVSSLAVDSGGRTVVILLGEGPGPRRLVQLARTSSASAGMTRLARMVHGPGDFWLTPVMAAGERRLVGLWDGEELVLMGGVGSLAVLRRLPMPFLKTEPHAALLIAPKDGDPTLGTVLIHDGPDVCHVDTQGRMLRRRLLNWRPTLPEGHTLRSVPLSWLQVDPERIELAGLDREGAAHWSSLRVNDAELIRTSNNFTTGRPAYAATTLVRAGLVAGVGPSGVDWLRSGSESFRPVGSPGPEVPGAMACFPSHRTGELVVVLGDGTLVCIPTPR